MYVDKNSKFLKILMLLIQNALYLVVFVVIFNYFTPISLYIYTELIIHSFSCDIRLVVLL